MCVWMVLGGGGKEGVRDKLSKEMMELDRSRGNSGYISRMKKMGFANGLGKGGGVIGKKRDFSFRNVNLGYPLLR